MSEISVSNEDLSLGTKANLLNVNLKFIQSLSDAIVKKNDSVLLLGKSKDLKKIEFSHLKKILDELKIAESWYNESIAYVSRKKEKSESGEESKSATGSNISWLNKFIISTISNKFSRHNAPSRAHLISKAIRQNSFCENQLIIIACEKKNSIPSACAVARTYPLFSRKTDKPKHRNVTVAFIYTDDIKSNTNPSDEDVKCFNVLAESVRLTAKIVDSPCAEMHTDIFLEEVKKVSKELGIEPIVIEGEELDKRGFGGLYNVGKAAVHPPKLIVLSNIKENAKRTVAWVGKGIVFDTGGLCIKPRTGMCTMKVDCGGAAAVLGAFNAAVKLGFEDNLHAIMCMAENAVAANAYRVDDIIQLYSGKSVEITNTDAEGRLVLGDGVAYASKDLNADVIVDIATLTGAQGPNTGKYHAAVLTNSDRWEAATVEIGKNCGDLCYPIIFAPELHFSEFNSEVADMKNSVSKADNATCSCAGLFIHSHLKQNYDGIWIHVDIASPVTESDRGTGFGVALLSTLFGDSIKNSAIRSISTQAQLPLKITQENSDDE